MDKNPRDYILEVIADEYTDQSDLSKRTGVSATTICKFLSGGGAHRMTARKLVEAASEAKREIQGLMVSAA